jgi:adenylate cyclase
MRKPLRIVLLSLAVAVLGGVLVTGPVGYRFEESVGLHWLFQFRGPIDPPPQVAIVTLDERPDELVDLAARHAESPVCPDLSTRRITTVWPRCLYGHLIEGLARRGAAVIALDVAFDEPDQTAEDEALADSIRRVGRVVLFEKLIIEKLAGDDIVAESLISPIGPIRKAAAGLGPFPLPKIPVRITQFWAFKKSAGDIPTLPVVALHVFAGSTLARFVAMVEAAGGTKVKGVAEGRQSPPGSAEALRDVIRNLKRTVGADPALSRKLLETLAQNAPGVASSEGSLLRALTLVHTGRHAHHLNFYGPPGTIRTIPASAVFGADSESEGPDLAGAVIFVGASELSRVDQVDSFYTVFSTDDGIDVSGVEILASAFANLLTGRTIDRPGIATALALVVVFGILIGSVAYLIPGWKAVVAVAAIGTLYLIGAHTLFARQDLWIPFAVPLIVQIPAALLCGLLMQYLDARGAWEKVDRALRYYVPERVAKALALDAKPDAGARQVYGAYLATDVEHYTTVSEKMQPLALRSYMNEYFDLVIRAVEPSGADLINPHADSLMCLWEEEDAQSTAAHLSCEAALAILHAVEEFNHRFSDRALKTRIGLHEGAAAIGNVGGGGRFRYELTGDAVNIASRLETLNKTLATTVLVSGRIAANAPNFRFRPVGAFVLLGRTSPLPVLELIGRQDAIGTEGQDLGDRFANALELFEGERWAEAGVAFDELAADYPLDGPSRFYRDLSRRYLAAPPPEGATVYMDRK